MAAQAQGSGDAPRAIPRLPTEVWARVAHYCSLLPDINDSLTALHALCLVDRTLAHLTVPLLYTRPVLDSAQAQGRFWSTVCDRPSLWSHVRSIVLGRRDWVFAPSGFSVHSSSPAPSVPRLTGLADALFASHSPSRASSTRWAEQFGLSSSNIAVPHGVGPEPSKLEEVAWWEAGGVGGLLAGHCYSTRPAGPWCQQAEQHRSATDQRMSRTTEDVDMGRGPGQPLHVPWNEGRRRHAEEATSLQLPSFQHRYDGKTMIAHSGGLTEEDAWEAAARMVSDLAITRPTALTASSQHSQDIFVAPSGKQSLHEVEAKRAAWAALALERKRTVSPRRVPWRYRLILGWLDGGLARFFETICTLVHIEITLYLGTHLDHDLLEHQLRLILDRDRLPLLQQLDIGIGHDRTSAGNNSRRARAAYARTVRLAVEAVDDPRCRMLGRDQGGGAGDAATAQDVLIDIPRDVKAHWEEEVGAEPWSDQRVTRSCQRATARMRLQPRSVSLVDPELDAPFEE
ncbi:unnamed protein product [Parajaminaea phylloscopi]